MGNPLLAGLLVLGGLLGLSSGAKAVSASAPVGPKLPVASRKPAGGWTPWHLTQEQTLQAILGGEATYEWIELKSAPGVFVFADALKINGIRVPVSAALTDDVCQGLDLLPTTAAVEDLIWQDADIRVYPKTYNPATLGQDVLMSEEAIQGFNESIDQQIAGRRGLVASVGKSWILDNRNLGTKGKAVNYGLATTAARRPVTGPFASRDGKYTVWQPPDIGHTPHHWDYSQTLRLCRITPGAKLPTGPTPLKATRLFYT